VSQGRGWWQASDGKWYPPHLHRDYQPEHPGDPTWWQAADGNWYPPDLTPPGYHDSGATATAATQSEAEEKGWSTNLLLDEEAPTVSGQRPSATWNVNRKPVTPEETLADLPPSTRGSSRVTATGIGTADLPPGARIEPDHQPPSVASVVALVLSVLVWPVGLIVTLVVRRRLRRTGAGGWALTGAALWVAGILAVATCVGVPLKLIGSVANLDTATHVEAEAVSYVNSQRSSGHQTVAATSALCVQRTGTRWSCQVSLANGTTEPLQVTVNNVGQQFQITEGTATQQVTSNADDRVAQTNLSTTLAAASVSYTQAQSYTTTDKFIQTLEKSEPDLTYTDQGSTGQDDISVDVADPTTLYLAAFSLPTGSCWIVRDQGSLSGVTYGLIPHQTPGSCKASAGPSVTTWSETFPS
jgi:hypothetical protein